ncbi:serine/threonine protein kinase [Pseudobutyrivibrio sp. 49]|uniref:Stk1 family PASTA domain-containing Ser/Thr kinase n=1 Tax=unclassified Pseudobutyrivibrio TaxID=2638619 RepID=UPI00087F3EB7|nr:MULTISPECIES: Stk1 family PASTA domain-containing Ser/Thr kinase [unclassified Pseudobutyrivibrio]SDI43704.1 serine/threonine protein kinase [Pseudobutyrivibrio sp. 49]SFN59447.1 serine/threonine protein kinase [Pseudobutyrivibrio sp. UC1225]
MITQGVFIADRYEIIDKVGSGGMSDVYRAKDHILGREVAIKILKPEFSEDATFVAKFRTEAQSAAGLEHPNIVNIYDVGSENGLYFIVMEYVEGITLKTYIEKKGQLNFKEAISIAIQVGRGIEAAHQKGIIHRDIKPQNIIISTEGKVKVTDFGIARAASSNTIHADVMGSVHYSSPEQARNGFVDGKSDIYSLGIVMYEMVTGRVPFDGDNTVAIAIQHLQEEMVAPSAYAPDLPISLEKIILKATMKKADRRYATISDMLMDLKKALVSPNEDFVTIVESDLGQTRVMHKVTPEQEESLTKRAAEALTFNDDYDDEYYDDEYYDDEYYDDDYDDEEEEDSKMDRILTISGIVAAVAIVAIVVAIVGNVVGLFNFGSKKVKMINVVGTQYEEALQQLEGIGLTDKNVVVSYEDNGSDVADGIITEQSVPEGKEFSLSDTLRLTVEGSDGSSDSGKSDSGKSDSSSSSSEGTVSVPSVVGMTQADATQTLSNSQIIVTSTTQEFSDEIASGSVISQSIEAGETVTPNTSITLVISKGKEEVTYSYSIPNPYDGECTYEIAELGKSGTIPKNGSINISEVKVDTLTVTLTYTPLYLSGDGTMQPNPNAKETSTQTVKGTAN